MHTIHFQIRNAIVAAVCVTFVCGCAGVRNRWLAFRTGNKPNATAESSVLDARQTADVQLALGRTAEQQQQWPTAMSIYRQVLEADSKQPEATHRLAVLYDRQGDFEQSAQWFQKALKLKSGDPDLFCDIGYSLYSQGRYDEAEINLRQAIAIAPDHGRAQNHLGLVLAQTGRHEEAFAAFRRANCSPAEAHTNLAVILALNENTEDARQRLQYAQSLETDDRGIQDRLAELEALIAGRESQRRSSPAVTDAQFTEVPNDGREADRPEFHWPEAPEQETVQAGFRTMQAAPVPSRPFNFDLLSEEPLTDDSNPAGR